MGADNQAERVIARVEYRQHLAKVFHTAFRKVQDLAPPWDYASEKHKHAVMAGIAAVLEEIPNLEKE